MKQKKKEFERTLSHAQRPLYYAMWLYLRKKGVTIETVTEEEFNAINDEFIANCNKMGVH